MCWKNDTAFPIFSLDETLARKLRDLGQEGGGGGKNSSNFASSIGRFLLIEERHDERNTFFVALQ